MEEKERYELNDNDCLLDNDNNIAICDFCELALFPDIVVDLLNKQDARIKELAEENEQLKKQLEEIKQTGSYQVMLMCQKENILLKQSQNQKAIEQLKKVKGNINKLPITDMTDYGGFKKIYQADATRIIDQQINELKGKVKNE